MGYKIKKMVARKQEGAIRKKIYQEYIIPTLMSKGQDPKDHANVANLLQYAEKEPRIEKALGIPAGSMRKVREANYSKLFVNNDPNTEKFKKKYKNCGIDF